MTDEISKHPLYLKALTKIAKLKREIKRLKGSPAKMRPWINENLEGPVIILEPDDLDLAIMGMTHDFTSLVYSYEGLIRQYAADGMTIEEAEEFVDFNTIRGLPYMGENPPVIIHKTEDIL